MTVQVSPVSSLIQHMSRDVYSGVATLLALCAGLTCSLTLRVLVDVWSYFVPAGPTTSVSQLWVATSLSSTEVWGPHSLTKPFWGQIAFTQIYLWWGGCPLFYLQIFVRTSIFIHINNTTFSLVTLKTW